MRKKKGTLAASVAFACPINFTIRDGLPKTPVNDKRYAPTRCPTILIRGAPNIRKVRCKAPDVFLRAFHINVRLTPRNLPRKQTWRCVLPPTVFAGHRQGSYF